MSQNDSKQRTPEDCAQELQSELEWTRQNCAIVGTAYHMFPHDEILALKQAVVSLSASNRRLVERNVAWRQRFQ